MSENAANGLGGPTTARRTVGKSFAGFCKNFTSDKALVSTVGAGKE